MSKQIGLETIAIRYAEAIYQLVESDKKKAEAVLDNLQNLQEVYNSNDDLRSFLEHPSVDLADKLALVKKIFTKFEADTQSLIMILLEKRRLNLMPLLAKTFRKQLNKARNIDVAKVSSAKPLAGEQLDEIKSNLEKIFGKSLEIETEIDETLIAGVKVNVGDQVLDSSVKAKLKQMRQLLTA